MFKDKNRLILMCVVMFILSLLILNSIAPVLAGTTLKSAQNSVQYYSWCGVPVFGLGVRGYYSSDGSKIVDYSTTYCLPWINTLSLWQYSNTSSSWIYKTSTKGICEAKATFTLGIGIQTQYLFVGIPIQTRDVFVQATALP
ncbi:hypothetical protein [Caldicellulosiruptor acetigenus]|uniref:Uncharacterized protein n=1 Tax=Caldicellulosiruptor acetigenus 6A TaxID=632516 RepID=G2PYI1_9FIRM|nr:hypothetical protein [Caldicellulosiruptor acetigenus]AEM74031.1 hypothetical protein Calla_1413 [Caldicellulosiruptor acetigenus 6A]